MNGCSSWSLYDHHSFSFFCEFCEIPVLNIYSVNEKDSLNKVDFLWTILSSKCENVDIAIKGIEGQHHL